MSPVTSFWPKMSLNPLSQEGGGGGGGGAEVVATPPPFLDFPSYRLCFFAKIAIRSIYLPLVQYLNISNLCSLDLLRLHESCLVFLTFVPKETQGHCIN